MEKYEQAFNIQPDPLVAHPISLVTMNEEYDVYTDSPLEQTIFTLIRLKIPEATGMSVKELLALPTYELKMIYRSVKKAKIIEGEIANAIT